MTISVLLADDHPLMRDGLKGLLATDTEISVVGEVSDGREAVRLTADLCPDIVIMDISMPGLNGIEACRLLRARSPGTKVVMLSMHSSVEHVFRAFQAGATAYLLKESAGDDIMAAVRAVHAGRRYLSPGLVDPAVGPHDASPGPLESLSARERQVLQLVVEGHSSNAIAALVHLSPKSVETYRSRLMRKLGVKDIPALVRLAIEHGIIQPH